MCGSNCLQAGGDPQSCGTQGSSCVTDPTLANAMNKCVTDCAAGTDGGTTDAATD